MRIPCGAVTLSTNLFGEVSSFTVLRVSPATQEQVTGLLSLDGRPGVDWWTPPRVGAPADVMVSPEARDAVLQQMNSLGLQWEVLHSDLQQHNGVVDRELAAAQLAGRVAADAYIDNKRYFLYDEIEDYIKRVAENHPNRVKVHDIGRTFEGRRMLVVHVSNCPYCNYTAIWVDAGIHAREWIAPATALFALSQLAENETAHADMREQLDWYILVVANPDGYQFTHTTDRMWRKTRSTTSMPGCYGADPNRNFDFHWNEVGASKNPCSETFAGRNAFSEIEAKNIRTFLWDNRLKIKLYISYHSYGNFILYPWGYTAENPKDWQTLKSVAMKANEAMVRAGSEPYTIGSSTQTLYAAAGGSDDWAKGFAGIPLSYTIELPGYKFGFQLPTSYIDAVARQSFEGLRAFASEVKRLRAVNGPNLTVETRAFPRRTQQGRAQAPPTTRAFGRL
ncbi:carboxypeptidase B-like isoform X2 [Thrips palmi]|uniref:Carboxypeptidase B-like isoform X2 n=1 Tax=Thrips palmi TaxID=161013 RepID=A0A6P9AIA5_THRPL|nr:carboxypeptidase B-like isoform X2 [Thrips palmi]